LFFLYPLFTTFNISLYVPFFTPTSLLKSFPFNFNTFSVFHSFILSFFIFWVGKRSVIKLKARTDNIVFVAGRLAGKLRFLTELFRF
ncbi:MAG: hypothetical protein LBQ47_00925, partial [Endomicrobium sp.]|nr:hypothetical protein [Endomicrobium sp.]